MPAFLFGGQARQNRHGVAQRGVLLFPPNHGKQPARFIEKGFPYIRFQFIRKALVRKRPADFAGYPFEMFQCQHEQAVEHQIRPGLCRADGLVHIGGPVIKIPVPALFKGEQQTLVELAHKGFQNGLQLIVHRTGQGKVVRVRQVFADRRKIMQRERGNGQRPAAGAGDGKQAVVAVVPAHQQQVGAGIVPVPVLKNPVAAQHLVSGIEGIEGLLPPGRVHIMLHQTQPECAHAKVIDPLPGGIAERLGDGRNGVDLRDDADILYFHGRFAENLQIPAAYSQKRLLLPQMLIPKLL